MSKTKTINMSLQKPKKRSSTSDIIDENHKKIEKHKSEHRRHSLQPGKMTRSADAMKPLKVLLERTKFNEMQLDTSKTSLNTSTKLVNGGLAKKPANRSHKKKNKLVPPYAASHKMSNLDRMFRIRRCYVKIPKDKKLAKLMGPLKLKRARGRPKKILTPAPPKDDSSKDKESPSAVVNGSGATGSGLKRKLTDGTDSSPPKRGRKTKSPKGTEFFINIDALTRRTPSPRRRVALSPKEEKQKKKPSPQLSPVALRKRFGCRFFRSYVKLTRVANASQVPDAERRPKNTPPKKKNKKNLSVSFLETVEVFGEVSDGDDYMDFEDSPNWAKGGRMRRLENDTEEPSSTSTPNGVGGGATRTPDSNRPLRSGGILKRKERISFSPLKEYEISPRKEELKLANEKIVRLSFEEQVEPPADEDEPEPALTKEPGAGKSPSPILSDKNDDDKADDEGENIPEISTESNSSALPLEPETVLITPPPSAENHEPALGDNAETQESGEKSHEEESSESAAPTTTANLKESGDHQQPSEANLDLHSNADEESLGATENVKQSPLPAPHEEQLPHEEMPERNQDNISGSSDLSFVDASQLVAAALLSDSTEADRHEAEAVLDDVCQMAAAENAALLSQQDDLPPVDVAFDSRPNDDVDDDFTSVLTHPELMEKSLQSAASTLVPNSQEIVVAAAAAAAASSQADVTEDTFASVVAEVERFTKEVNPGLYADEVGLTGDDVMMDNVQASNSLDDIFDDDVDDDIISSLRMSSGSIDIGHDKSLPIQVIETEVMAIPNEPDLIFDKPLGTNNSILGTTMSSANDTHHHGHGSAVDTNSKMSLGRLFQSVKSYMMSPGGEKNSALHD